jgi:hypothetical protein
MITQKVGGTSEELTILIQAMLVDPFSGPSEDRQLALVVFSRKGFSHKKYVLCSILFSHYLLTSGTRAVHKIE